MPKTLIYKILEAHLVDGELKAGAPIGIRIDQTLTQDITGTMAMMEYEAMGAPKRLRFSAGGGATAAPRCD